MFCTKCGKEINDDSLFCPECGNRITNAAASSQQTQSTYQQQTYQQQMPTYKAAPTSNYSNNYNNDFNPGSAYNDNNNYVDESQKNSLGVRILVFGILSLAISFIPGWIFGAIAKRKAEEYLGMYGNLTGTAKVGKILGTIGLICSIVTTILFSLYFGLYCCIYGMLFAMI